MKGGRGLHGPAAGDDDGDGEDNSIFKMRRKKSEFVSMVQDVAIQSVDLQVLPSEASSLNCFEGRISRSGGDQDVKHDASIFQYARKEENGNVNNSSDGANLF